MQYLLQPQLLRSLLGRSRKEPYYFTILRPAGNDTGLVGALIQDAKQRKKIADALRNKYTNIEQVGFINRDPNNAELIMTGGEFCGNATSSAAHLILNGKPGTLKIKVSGVKGRLLAGVTESGDGFSQMPVYQDLSSIQLDSQNTGNALVSMEGITHYVDFNSDQIKGLTIDEIKAKARKQMAEKGIDQHVACGIIYVKKMQDKFSIHPVVYVRDADTLFYETACGSGTTALGVLLAYKKGGDIQKLPIVQPSGLTIKVSVSFDGKHISYAQIQSSIHHIYEGTITNSLSVSSVEKQKLKTILPKLIH